MTNDYNCHQSRAIDHKSILDGRNQFQLLPGTKKRLGIRVPGENRFLYIGSAILGAALVTSFALSRYENNLQSQLGDLNEQISAIEQRRDMKMEESLKIIKQQIDITSGLLKNHTYWTRGLFRIASLIQNEVQLDSLSYSGDNKIIIKAIATSYAVLAKQIASLLYDESITDLELGRIIPSPDGTIEFNITLTFDVIKLIKYSGTE